MVIALYAYKNFTFVLKNHQPKIYEYSRNTPEHLDNLPPHK